VLMVLHLSALLIIRVTVGQHDLRGVILLREASTRTATFCQVLFLPVSFVSLFLVLWL
jgi:hypothetical protein